MDRKKAIVAAATVAGSLLAASTAYALTSGIVGNGPDDGAGDLSPVVEAPLDDAGSQTTSGPTTDATSGGAGSSQVNDDNGGTRDDDGFESDDHVDDGFESDDHVDDDSDEHDDDSDQPFEYEGREDDD